MEVSEGTTAACLAGAQEKLALLRRNGFEVALDDLGAGHAGLGSLARLQPQYAKVDRELIRDIHTDPLRQKIARGLVAMCRELDVQLIAEGVERVEELETLAAAGCDLYQGFLFCRPQRPFPAVSWPVRPIR